MSRGSTVCKVTDKEADTAQDLLTAGNPLAFQLLWHIGETMSHNSQVTLTASAITLLSGAFRN